MRLRLRFFSINLNLSLNLLLPHYSIVPRLQDPVLNNEG
jgi:hypothetical protein